MAKVERIMFCLDELGGAEPSLDQDICRPRGIRYRGLSVTPPKEWLSPWSRKRDEGRTGNWKLCVPEASAAGDALQQEESGRNEAVERVVKARIRILAVVFPVQRARPQTSSSSLRSMRAQWVLAFVFWPQRPWRTRPGRPPGREYPWPPVTAKAHQTRRVGRDGCFVVGSLRQLHGRSLSAQCSLGVRIARQAAFRPSPGEAVFG